jgi:WASH complex subunit 7
LGKFVSKYSYNIHTQVFIEITTETKQIKTIGVNQMLYSIKTHGIGVMGTVINTFYKFLVKKLNIFNEFLYDEFIHNPLMQEQRYYKKNKESLANLYPYERAENMARTIKRLGMTKGGISYLDKFRQLITHIGNALGYVRMIRSASLKDNSNLVKYIP